jgi:hypothetical protein
MHVLVYQVDGRLPYRDDFRRRFSERRRIRSERRVDDRISPA